MQLSKKLKKMVIPDLICLLFILFFIFQLPCNLIAQESDIILEDNVVDLDFDADLEKADQNSTNSSATDEDFDLNLDDNEPIPTIPTATTTTTTATSPALPTPESFVKWEVPKKEILENNWINITLSGRATPNCKMIIYKDSFISYPNMFDNIWSQQYTKISTQKLLAKISPIEFNPDGTFQIKFKLPKYRMKFIIAFRDNFGNIQKNLIKLKLDGEALKYKIELLSSNFEKQNPDKNFKYLDLKARNERLGIKVNKHELWLGSGISFLSYANSYSTGQANLNFMSTNFAPLFAKLKMPIGDNFKFQLSGNQSAGTATVDELLTLSGSKNFTWQTASIENYYTPPFLQFNPFDISLNFEPSFGAFYQMAPFLLQKEVSEYSIIKNKFVNLSAGLRIAINDEASHSFELFGNYQYLIYDSSDLKLVTNNIYEFGASWTYTTSERWRLALTGTKRTHLYGFDYNNSSLNDESTVGTYLLDSSILELRLGYIY